MLRRQITRLATLAASFFFIVNADALTLPELLRAASDNHPTIQAARQGFNAANEDVSVARRQYWPTVSAAVQSQTSNGITPASLLRVEQTLWDFGLTKANVNVTERGADIANAALEMQRQTIKLEVIDAWRILQASYGRLQVAQEMLKRLHSYEAMMLRRVAGELSAKIELDLVRSRILQGQVELTQAQTSIQVSTTKLQNLTGLQNLGVLLAVPPPLPLRAQLEAQARLLDQTDWNEVVNHQPTVLRAVDEMRQGKERIKVKIAESRPQIFARFDQAVNGQRDRAIYLGLNYSPGAGFSKFIEERALAARALALEQSVEATRIAARQLLDLDNDDLRDSNLRTQSLEAAVQGAQRVLESYERQFTAGRKTWLDLMNAVREMAQNAYALVDANASQAAALYRLELRVNPEMIDAPVEIQVNLPFTRNMGAIKNLSSPAMDKDDEGLKLKLARVITQARSIPVKSVFD